MRNMLKKYSSLPIPAKASLWFILTSVLQKSISFITVPLFTRLLSPEEFGLINIYQSWLGIITIFATLTLWGGVFNNGMVKYDDDREVFMSSLQGLSTTITFILLLVFLVSYDTLSKFIELPILLVTLMFIQIIFTPSLYLWSAKQRFDFKYKKLVLITILISFANPILGIVFVRISDDGGLARIVSIALVQITFGIILYINNIKLGKKFFHKNYWKYALNFNIPLIPHYLSQTVLNQADKIMINNLVGTDKAGIYSIAYSIGMIFLFIVSSVNSTFIPWTYKKLKNESYEAISKISYLLLLFISAAILILISLAPEIIILMAPPEYSEAIWAIPPIALSVFFIFLYGLFANVEFYFEESKFIMIASITTAIINIVLNLIMIPIYGYIAAGYTTLFSYIIYNVSHYFFMRKILAKNKVEESIYDLKKIIILAIVLISASILITLTYELFIIRYFSIILLILIVIVNKKLIINRIKLLRD